VLLRSSLSLLLGNIGVISSKFLRFIASAGCRPFTVFTYKSALNFSVEVLILVFPLSISPVFRLNLLIWDGETYTSFSPGR